MNPEFIVGVTGHRDIHEAALPRIEEVVVELLSELKQQYGRVAVLSPLAEGADRIVAGIGLRLGIPLIAVLPFPTSVYVEDFKSLESKAQFYNLLSQASSVTHLSSHGDSPAERNEGYIQVGRAVVKLSHLLLALWDGQMSGKPGGTSDIVRYFMEESGAKSANQSDLYWIYTPRVGTAEIDLSLIRAMPLTHSSG